jgi:hypothetical protein
MRGPISLTSSICIFFHPLLGFPLPLGACERGPLIHVFSVRTKNSRERRSRILLVSSGVWWRNQFVSSCCVIRVLRFLPSSSCFVSSFIDHFGSFLLSWSVLWRELNLSTEGNQPIPHELVDRVISWSRLQEPVVFVLLRFPVDWLQIGRWPLRGSSPTTLWSYSPSFVEVGEDLAAN